MKLLPGIAKHFRPVTKRVAEFEAMLAADYDAAFRRVAQNVLRVD
jgi:hypothetical protein